MSLRAKLIEAGAEAVDPFMVHPLETRDAATVVLDAFLDCLAENADEINEQAITAWRERMGDIPFDGPLIVEFVEVLRGSDV